MPSYWARQVRHTKASNPDALTVKKKGLFETTEYIYIHQIKQMGQVGFNYSFSGWVGLGLFIFFLDLGWRNYVAVVARIALILSWFLFPTRQYDLFFVGQGVRFRTRGTCSSCFDDFVMTFLLNRQYDFVLARFAAVLKSSLGGGSYGLSGFCFVGEAVRIRTRDEFTRRRFVRFSVVLRCQTDSTKLYSKELPLFT